MYIFMYTHEIGIETSEPITIQYYNKICYTIQYITILYKTILYNAIYNTITIIQLLYYLKHSSFLHHRDNTLILS